MITGVVAERRALVRLTVRGPEDEVEIEFVIDTGFAGYLALPPAAAVALKLPEFYPTWAHLADGSRTQVYVYDAAVLWDGEERVVEVLGAGPDPLVGMSLLDGCDLHVEVTDGGLVAIDTL